MRAHAGLGAHLLALRCARALTQQQLAERAGLAADSIRRLENDGFSPSLFTLEKLARALRMPASQLLAGYELRERDIAGEVAGILGAVDPSLLDELLLLLSDIADLVTQAELPSSVPSPDYGARTIAEHVKVLREVRGLNQAQLAERAGCSVDSVRRAEGGRRMSLATLESLSLAMGLRLSTFFEGLEPRDTRSVTGELEWIDRLDLGMQLCVLRVLERLRVMLVDFRSEELHGENP